MKSVHRELAVTVQLNRSSTAVGAPFGGATAPRIAPVEAGDPPPSDESA
jgi:hypothetical protein